MIDVKELIAHVQRASHPVDAPEGWTGAPVVLVPSGWQATPAPGWEPESPDRIRAHPKFTDLASFVDYVAQFNGGTTKIFADLAKGNWVAIFDYHSVYKTTMETTYASPSPAWCQHRATLEPTTSCECAEWTAKNKSAMSQVDFAQFLEDRLPTIIDPPGADLLGIINTFQVEGTMSFSRSQRLADGSVKLVYQNENRAKSGEVDVPAMITIRVPFWNGTDSVKLNARLRYRLKDGNLSLWYELVQYQESRRGALLLMNELITKSTGIRPLIGTP